MKVKLESPEGEIKEVKVGFSWITLFFYCFVPFFRKDWKWLGIMLGAMILGGMLSLSLNVDTGIGLGLNIAFAILYNNFYINDLLKKVGRQLPKLMKKF